MTFFVQPSDATKPKARYVSYVSLALAAVFVILAVAQLYSYESFSDVIASMWLPGGRTYAPVLSATIVILEVAALPFLLSFRLSPAMRFISMLAGWLAASFWLIVSVWEILSVNAITNSGLFGATISTTPGWWLVGVTMLVGLMTAYVSWGIWPRSDRRTMK
jgi:hypothetical protein